MEERLKQLIEELVRIPGPSGQEDLVAAYLQEQFKPFADEAWVDKSGNSIAKFNGTSGRTIVVAAHMDEVFTVAHGYSPHHSHLCHSTRLQQVFCNLY